MPLPSSGKTTRHYNTEDHNMNYFTVFFNYARQTEIKTKIYLEAKVYDSFIP
jgi:hypothetical protein